MKRVLTIIITLSLILAACGSNATGIVTPVLPYNPVNEGWKAIENYKYAYNTRDANLLAATLDSEFLHLLKEEDWGDYNGDGTIDSTWGYDLEMTNAQILFSSCEAIELTLEGLWYYPWPADSTSESIAFPRNYRMKMYYSYPDSGAVETGQFTMVCRPDSTDTWYLTHLIDQE
ncbi:MAG: hypothetical protein KAR40_01505 [Candidatus Sabulitectum sp.]|nr:hypothetical protein [Candidatus Sabulitectum sp.]